MKRPFRLIFLDIDGVLNSQLYFAFSKDLRTNMDDQIDPIAVGFLNKLCAETGAKVVVSSTWRLNRTIQQLQTLLEGRGFTGKVIDKTPSFHDGHTVRGNEIKAWLQANEKLIGCAAWDYHDYVILDDDSDMLYEQREHLILTDAYVGLTPNACYRAKGAMRVPRSLKEMS